MYPSERRAQTCMRNTFWQSFFRETTFDLLNNQLSVTSYCRRMIITIQSWIKKLILQGLEMPTTVCSAAFSWPWDRERVRAASAADICACKISLVINHKAIIGWLDERSVSGKVFLDVFNRCWVVWSVNRSCFWFAGPAVQRRLIRSWYVWLPRIQLIRLLLFLPSTFH